MDEPVAHVFLRPIGSPLTIGMSGLAVASLVQSGFDLRWIATSQATEVGLILLAVPFVLQLLACVFSYLARDGAAGAAIGVLATTWAAMGLVHIVALPGSRSGALGLLLIASAGALALAVIAMSSAKPLPGVVFLFAAVRFALAGIYELGAGGFWRDAAGVVGLVVLGLSAYCVVAFELEGQQRGPVLPTFRRGRGALAMRGGVAAQLDGVAHEAGGPADDLTEAPRRSHSGGLPQPHARDAGPLLGQARGAGVGCGMFGATHGAGEQPPEGGALVGIEAL